MIERTVQCDRDGASKMRGSQAEWREGFARLDMTGQRTTRRGTTGLDTTRWHKTGLDSTRLDKTSQKGRENEEL